MLRFTATIMKSTYEDFGEVAEYSADTMTALAELIQAEFDLQNFTIDGRDIVFDDLAAECSFRILVSAFHKPDGQTHGEKFYIDAITLKDRAICRR